MIVLGIVWSYTNIFLWKLKALANIKFSITFWNKKHRWLKDKSEFYKYKVNLSIKLYFYSHTTITLNPRQYVARIQNTDALLRATFPFSF